MGRLGEGTLSAQVGVDSITRSIKNKIIIEAILFIKIFASDHIAFYIITCIKIKNNTTYVTSKDSF